MYGLSVQPFLCVYSKQSKCPFIAAALAMAFLSQRQLFSCAYFKQSKYPFDAEP